MPLLSQQRCVALAVSLRFFLQDLPELAGILAQNDIDKLETDIDPVNLCATRLTKLVSKCVEDPIKNPPPIVNAMDTGVRGLLQDFSACQRILSKLLIFCVLAASGECLGYTWHD